MKGHEIVEKNIGLMTVFMVIAISFGGLVEIVPQFFLKQTTTPIEGLKPLNAVQLEGRDVYIREGCHVCGDTVGEARDKEPDDRGGHEPAAPLLAAAQQLLLLAHALHHLDERGILQPVVALLRAWQQHR